MLRPRRLVLGVLLPALLPVAAAAWIVPAYLSLAGREAAVADGVLRLAAEGRTRAALALQLQRAAAQAGLPEPVVAELGAAAGRVAVLAASAGGAAAPEALSRSRAGHQDLTAALDRIGSAAGRLGPAERGRLAHYAPALERATRRVALELEGLEDELGAYTAAAGRMPGSLVAGFVSDPRLGPSPPGVR